MQHHKGINVFSLMLINLCIRAQIKFCGAKIKFNVNNNYYHWANMKNISTGNIVQFFHLFISFFQKKIVFIRYAYGIVSEWANLMSPEAQFYNGVENNNNNSRSTTASICSCSNYLSILALLCCFVLKWIQRNEIKVRKIAFT